MKLPTIHSDAFTPDLHGLRVAFVQSPIRESVRPNNLPLSCALLAARLERCHADVRIVDLNVQRPVVTEAQARAKLEAVGERDLFCVSGLITTLAWQERIARIIREIAPDAAIVSGGGLATNMRAGLFEWIPELDAVCHSEGDDVILRIAMETLAGEVHGSRKVYDGYRSRDLDALPFPAWHLFDPEDLEAYIKAPIWGESAHNSSASPLTMERSINTVSSRGCPFFCSFCDRTATGERNYGTRSARNLWDELEAATDILGVDFVGITDDNFMVQPSRIFEMADLGPVVRWGTHGRLDEAADMRKGELAPRLRVEAMAEAGCAYIGFGAESACPKTLKRMGKGGQMLANGLECVDGYGLPSTMLQGIRNTVAAGIHPNCTWIGFYSGETLEDLKHSIAFIEWQKTQHSHVNTSLFSATAYPGTAFFEDPHTQEVLSRAFGLSFTDGGKPVMDAAYHRYVVELEDATKLITGDDGRPVNFSAMDDELVMQIRDLVDAGRTEEILGL